MWNQGNGNGQGNGYGNQGYGQQEDVYGRLNNTKELGGARFPFLEGSGRYALCTLEEFTTYQDGPAIRAMFEVLDSKDGKHPVGSYVMKIWKICKPAMFPGGLTNADEFADFCRKLKGAPQGYPIGNDIRVLVKERVHDQLARGTVIDAVAVLKPAKPKRDGSGMTKPWTAIYFNAVQQTPAEIAARRAQLEQKGIPDTTGGSGGQQFQGAPHPAAMPQTYPAQGQAQPGYQMQNTQWSQPQGQPQPAQASNNTPGTGVPPGGFLASVPPQGQGGGNGGQGTW